MASFLGAYDPIVYAQRALWQLEKVLGMARRVHRGYEDRPQNRGSVITIRIPSEISIADAPATAQELTTDSTTIVLNQWKETKFKLTDKELAYAGDRLIEEHIRRCGYKIANEIDSQLCGLYADVPWFHDVASTAGPADIVAAYKQLFDNEAPVYDGNLTMMVDSDMYADFLKDAAFAQYQGSGDAGTRAQVASQLGRRYDFDIWATQNIKSHTKGTASTGTLAVNNASGYAVGATSMNLDAVAVTGTLVPGDTFVIAGHTQRYAVTGTFTASGNAFAGVTFTPSLKAAVADDAVVTVSLDNHSAGIAFHQNAFALAMAPLPDHGRELGARVATVSDPVTGLAIRSRIYYVGNSSEVHVAFDALWGVKTLDPNLAVRMRN